MPSSLLSNKSLAAVVLVFTCLAASCVGNQADSATELAAINHSDPWSLEFAPPVDALKSASMEDADRFCYGADYASEIPNQRVTPQGTHLLFKPTWDVNGEPSLDDLAYAMYVFLLDGYADQPQLIMNWSGTPQDWTSCFVGLGNQQYNRWDWFTDADFASGTLTLEGLAPYLDGDGGLVMTMLLSGIDECTLGWLRWGGNVAPIAALGADPTSGSAPLAVGFNANGSYDPDGALSDFEWDFDGDGEFNEPGPEADARSNPAPYCTYNDAGAYMAAVRVTDTDDAKDTVDVEIQVISGNEPPVAVLIADPSWGEPPLVVSFSAEGSYDPDGTIENYEWDLDGDDQWGESGEEADAGGNATAEYTYAEESTYTAWVRVTDDEGASDTASVAVSVSTAGPGAWPMRGHDLLHTGRSPYIGAQTNSVKWSYTTGNWVLSSPAIAADGTVYVGSRDYRLHALNPDGSLKWSYHTDYWVFSSPAIGADGTVYVGSEDGKLYALYPDGSLKWSYTTEAAVYSSPAIGADGTVYVGSEDGKLYALYPDGSLKWSYTTGSSVESSPSVGVDGTVYVGSADHNLYALNPDGSLKWSYTTGLHIWKSSPAVGADGTVYVGSRDYKLHALNPDGSLKWSYAMGGEVHTSPAIGADGTVYIGTIDRKLYALNPDGSLKWTYTTGGSVWSSPAIGADGTVYVGSHDGKLYAIGPGSA